MIFQLQRYAEWLRDRCQDRATPLSETAWLLACGLLDARIDTLLIPILVSPPPVDLPAWLESQDWELPSGFWTARLADGACILLFDDPACVEAVRDKWPRCPYLVCAAAAPHQ